MMLCVIVHVDQLPGIVVLQQYRHHYYPLLIQHGSPLPPALSAAVPLIRTSPALPLRYSFFGLVIATTGTVVSRRPRFQFVPDSFCIHRTYLPGILYKLNSIIVSCGSGQSCIIV